MFPLYNKVQLLLVLFSSVLPVFFSSSFLSIVDRGCFFGVSCFWLGVTATYQRELIYDITIPRMKGEGFKGERNFVCHLCLFEGFFLSSMQLVLVALATLLDPS